MSFLKKKVDVSKREKPTGLRFKGTKKALGKKYFLRPERILGERALANAKHKGLVYYEPRLSKSDMRQDRKFAQGGIIASAINFLNKKVTLSDLF